MKSRVSRATITGAVALLLLVAALPQPLAFVAKAEFIRNPFMRLLLSRIGAVFVERCHAGDPNGRRGWAQARQRCRCSARGRPVTGRARVAGRCSARR